MRANQFSRLVLLAALALPAATADLLDPMRPATGAGPAVKQKPAATRTRTHDWQLQSTLIAGDRRSAVINGRLVEPGARVLGARVIGIDHDRVTLEESGRRFEVRAYNPIHKKNQRGGDS